MVVLLEAVLKFGFGLAVYDVALVDCLPELVRNLAEPLLDLLVVLDLLVDFPLFLYQSLDVVRCLSGWPALRNELVSVGRMDWTRLEAAMALGQARREHPSKLRVIRRLSLVLRWAHQRRVS